MHSSAVQSAPFVQSWPMNFKVLLDICIHLSRFVFSFPDSFRLFKGQRRNFPSLGPFFPRREERERERESARSFVAASTKDLFPADATRVDNINVGNTGRREKEREREREREREKREVERIERERPWFDLSRATTCLWPWRRTSGTRDVLFASEDIVVVVVVVVARRYRSIRLGVLTALRGLRHA